MKIKLLTLVMVGLGFLASVSGQGTPGGPKKAAPAKKDASDGNEAEVRFANGSTVFMTILHEPIEVQTDYGKLLIPPAAIRGIEFGIHLPEGVEEKIELLLRQLGSKNYRERDGAVRALAALGAHAYPALQRAAKDKEQPEAAQRALAAIKIIERKVPARQLRIKQEDVIRTSKFTVVGRILNPSIKARAEYFGEVSLKPYMLHTIRCLQGAGESEVVVEAARYGSQHNQWMDSGLMVDPQLDLVILASGQVDLWPQGPGQYMTGPAGTPGGGRGQPGAAIVNGMPVGPGMLIGRVGEDGAPFIIGDRYSGRPGRVGKLYLHIGPSAWNNASTGAYRVRVATGNNLIESGR